MKKRLTAFLAAATVVAIAIWFLGRPREPAPRLEPSGPAEIAKDASTPPPPAVPPIPPADPTAPSLPKPAPDAEPPPPPGQVAKASPLPPSARRDLDNPLAPSSLPGPPPPQPAESDPDVAADLGKVLFMLRDYRTIAGENPVGTNAEIMKAVMGANPRGAKLGPPEGMSVNGEGELVDHWGTPLFFHQLSKDLMEVHSAGPDRRMGTEDDFVMK